MISKTRCNQRVLLVFIQKIVDSLTDFAALNIDPAHPAAQVADLLVVEAAGNGADQLRRDPLIAALSHKHHRITGNDLGNLRHIHHKLIHTDSTQNRGFSTLDQHIKFSGQTPTGIMY